MQKETHRLKLSFITIGLVALISAGCSPTGSVSTIGQNEVLRAVDDNADIAIYANLKKMSEASIIKKLDEMQDDVEQTAEARMQLEKIKSITGLDTENFIHMALSITNVEAMQLQPQNVRLSAAVYVDKPVTAEQVAETIYVLASEDNPDMEPLEIISGDGADFIALPPVDNGPELTIAVVTGTGSSTVYFGDIASLEAAIQRSISDVPERLLQPSANLITGEQGWISIIIPEAFREDLSEMAQQAAMMVGPGASALETLQSLGIATRAADQLDIAIGFNLASEEAAEKIQMVLDNSVISTARMMLSGQTSEPLPVLQSLTATQSGNRATLSLSLTLKDFQIVQNTFSSPSY